MLYHNMKTPEALITMQAACKDNLSFLATINACARGQQHTFTQHMLKTMDTLQMEKTKEIYTAAMGSANDSFGQGLEGGWEWSISLLMEMQSTEVEADAVALGVVLSVCLRGRGWEVALHLAPRFQKTPFAFRVFLGSGNIKKKKKVCNSDTK